MKEKNWKDFISKLLTRNGTFQLIKSEKIFQTDVELYECTDPENQSNFEVGYVDNALMYLNLSNEDVPGYTKYKKGEYYFDSDFDHNRQSRTGLSFDEINCKGIEDELQYGLTGREEQYLIDDKVIYSRLYLEDEHFLVDVDLTGRNFWQKLFGPKIPNKANTKFKVIDLSQIFPGI